MKKEDSFETVLQKLEAVVEALDGGELPLEEAMQTFEEGVRLSKLCSQKLDAMEKRITVILQEGDGTLSERPYATSTADSNHD
jgi:exodeoxyribonuclease VII small subunit